MTTRAILVWAGLATLVVLAAYTVVAYLVLPAVWTKDERRTVRRPGVMVTETAQGIPGDPLNIGIVATLDGLHETMAAAGWYPANRVTLRTSAEIVGSVIFDRPYHDAPVSPLFHDGRREDYAFEKPLGTSADRRQHVRFWREGGAEEPPLWIGAVTLDAGIGLSHYTGAVTHRIDPDIDAARAALVADLTATGQVAGRSEIEGVGATADGRNGEGDPYRTDGRADVLMLAGD